MPQRGSLAFLLILTGALALVLFLIARPFLSALFVAVLLAILLEPLKQRLTRQFGRPALATLLCTVVTMVLLAGVAATAGYSISREVAAAYSTVNQRSAEGGGWQAFLDDTVDRVVDSLAARLPIQRDQIRAELLLRLREGARILVNWAGAAVGGVTTFVFDLILVAIFLYFFLSRGERWILGAARLAQLDSGTAARILSAVRDSVFANILGIFAVAAAQGLLLIFGFWFVGVRAPVLWGVLGGLASMIPVVGAPLVWVPVVLGFAIAGSYGKALLLGLWGALFVGTIDNLLRPVIIGTRLRQHPLIIGLAAIGGTIAFGPLGFLAGPLAVSLAAALLNEIKNAVSGGDPTPERPIP